MISQGIKHATRETLELNQDTTQKGIEKSDSPAETITRQESIATFTNPSPLPQTSNTFFDLRAPTKSTESLQSKVNYGDLLECVTDSHREQDSHQQFEAMMQALLVK